MTKSKKKILATIMLVLMLITNILPICKSFAVQVGDNVTLVGIGTVPHHLKNKAISGDGYVNVHVVGYYDNGQFYPAYCMNQDRKGADNEHSYNVTLTELLADTEMYNRVWRVVTNGYPYQSLETLGVSSPEYAFQATKMAIYCVLGQSHLENFYADDDIGQSIVNAIHRLVNIGLNGTSTYRTPAVEINKTGEMILSGDYYIQNYNIGCNVEIVNYDIAKTGFPAGTIITNTLGEEKTTFSQGEAFQLRIPKDIVENQDINGRLRADANTKSYALFYSTNFDPNLQGYATTADPVALTNSVANITLKANTASIKIRKVDVDTNESIENTTFELSKEDGTIIGTATTNAEGEVIFNELYQGNYIIKEVKANDNYVAMQEVMNIRAEYNKMSEITIENEHKKGDLKVYKVDSTNNKIGLGNVKFDLFSEEFNKVIGSYSTDANGELEIKGLRTGNYSLIEKETNKWYNLAENTDIKIEWKETTETTIKNELKKGKIKVIKVDAENNEVKLKDVEFNVISENGNVLETIKTDENGEATTREYILRDNENLVLQETKTNESYALNETPIKVKLEANQITNVTFENEKIKGKVEITKISADDNKLTGDKKGTPLANVVFEIYNDKDEIIETLTTDKNGKATSSILEYGKYYIKEKDTNSENYLLNTNKYEFEIKEHMKTVPVTIENTSVDIGLDIDKNGVVQAQPNDEIKYGFNTLKNTSNVALDNFTWTDNLPHEYIKITKLFTGTYNEDLDYVVKYKTNKTDDYIEFGKYNTQKNNYIDFTKIELAVDEYITDFKVEFGTVMAGFEAVERPFIFAKVLPTVKPEDKWINYTTLTGNYKEHKLEDKAEWPTISYGKKLEIKKLPKTGF